MRLGIVCGGLGDESLEQDFIRALTRYLGEGVSVRHLETADLPQRTPTAVPTPSTRSFLQAARDVDGLVIMADAGTSDSHAHRALGWLAGEAWMRGMPAAVAGIGPGRGTRSACVLDARHQLADMGAITMPRPDADFSVERHAVTERSVVNEPELEESLAQFSSAARAFFARRIDVKAIPAATVTPLTGTGADAVKRRAVRASRLEKLMAASPAQPHQEPGSPLSSTPSLIANPKRSRA